MNIYWNFEEKPLRVSVKGTELYVYRYQVYYMLFQRGKDYLLHMYFVLPLN